MSIDEPELLDLIPPNEFNQAWQARQRGEEFSLDVGDGLLLQGRTPRHNERDELMADLVPSSLASLWFVKAWEFEKVEYIVLANQVLIAFLTPLGWCHIPRMMYMGARMDADWKLKHSQATETLFMLNNAEMDEDYA